MFKTAQESNRDYIKNSIRAFIAGAKNLNWIIGIIQSSAGPENLPEIINELANHLTNESEKNRFSDLIEELKRRDFLR